MEAMSEESWFVFPAEHPDRRDQVSVRSESPFFSFTLIERFTGLYSNTCPVDINTV